MGAGQPVLVIPGFLANDAATSMFRRSIDAAGMKSHTWGRGLIVKINGEITKHLDARCDAISAASGGRKVILVGWSLGGLFARQLALEHPAKIGMVMTLGSPFSGDVHANNAWRLIEGLNGDSIERLTSQYDFATKPPVHTVAVWSANDGIVAPLSARGDPDQSDERIELGCTHMGFCAIAEGVRAVVKLLVERAQYGN
jgi:pimeloyl-ACP methyl ester carboxylesterase